MVGCVKLFLEIFEGYFWWFIVVSVLIVIGVKMYMKCEVFFFFWLGLMEVDNLYY